MPDPARLRRTALVAASLALPLALGACGGDEKVGPKPDLPTEAVARWNPCDALDAAFVKAQFGIDATEHTGTPTKPECRFTPAEGSGDAVIKSNYLLFGGTLDQAWKTMGQRADADVRTPKVDDADDARVVVNATKEQLYVTGFVQNGGLIQQVDVVDPAPYAEKQVVRGVVATLTALSTHAADTGAGADPSASAS
jgi:hypothetical protein